MKMRLYPIADNEARCRPHKFCAQQHYCMRFKAPLPLMNGSVMDGLVSAEAVYGMQPPTKCVYHLEIPPDERQP